MAALEDLIALRTEELRRRVDGLDRELTTWVKRCNDEKDLQPNQSQVAAIDALVRTFLTLQRKRLEGLSGPSFATKAFVLADDIALTQGVWDFFRDKLELRFNPHFKERIAVADTIAWNCYMPVLEKAAEAGLVQKNTLREPPLTYLAATLFAGTLQRGRQPHVGDTFFLREEALPIPVIELPWDNLENLWELLSIPHEVGHDLDVDLGLGKKLGDGLDAALSEAGLDDPEVDRWRTWRPEVLADFVALQLVGPPYAEYLLGLLLSEDKRALEGALELDPKHPPPFARIRLCAEYIESLIADPAEGTAGGVVARTQAAQQRLAQDAADLRERWKAFYPGTPDEHALYKVSPVLIEKLMDTPLDDLGQGTLRDLMPYGFVQDERLRERTAALAKGALPADLTPAQPRECLAAARSAATRIAASGRRGDDLRADLAALDELAQKYVEASTRPGVRAPPSPSRQAFFASFADKLRGGLGLPTPE